MIRSKVIGLAILQPVNVTSSSYNLSVIGVDKIFVNYNGPVSIVLNTLLSHSGSRPPDCRARRLRQSDHYHYLRPANGCGPK